MRGVAIAAILLASAPAWALTGAKVDVDQPELAAKADEVVEVNLEGKSLDQGRRLLAIRHEVGASVKGLLNGLKGLYRRTYRFATGGYDDSDVASIHERMTGEGWQPLLDVKDNGRREAVTVYSYTGAEGSGYTVVSSDPSEVTVVNLVGEIDLDALMDASESLGMPIMRIGSTELQKLRTPPPGKP